MSSLVYPANLPGLSFNSVRTPSFNTGVQQALSKKESRIAYQQYPQMKWELTYELLRNYTTPSDLRALFGLFMNMGGKFDDFLYSDPEFNSVTAMQFGLGDGSTAAFQVTATYQNAGGPGAPELVQNFSGAPVILVSGATQTLGTAYTIGATGLVTFLGGHIPAAAAVVAWTGSFFYRARFDDDDLDFNQFMNQFWETKKVKLLQVKL